MTIRNKSIFTALTQGFFLFFLCVGVLQAHSFKLYQGDMKVLELGKITRVAVGNGKLLSTSILDNGNLLVLAEKDGDTELRVWLATGEQRVYTIYITPLDSARTSSEAALALKNVHGIKTRRVGKNIIVEGTVNEQTSKLLETIAGKYSDMINLTTVASGEEIAALLSFIPGITVNTVGKYAVVSGNVDAEGKTALESIIAIYPDILNLTTDRLLIEEPMIYMSVQITEFNTNALENLGINWSTSFNGPAIGFTSDSYQQGDSSISTLNNQSVLDTGNLADASAGAGFFGITTLITSSINLAVANGDALLLASPTLSAKSGGVAEFLSGGQIPVPVPGANGATTIEYKDYGIILNIEPQADKDGLIISKVKTEVSTLDKSVSYGNVPGFRTRTASTEVSMRDGETLVISGLVSHELGKDKANMAFLSKIPILGALFRSKSFRNARSDLVVFITPHIVDANSEINKKAIAKSADLRNKFITAIDEGLDLLEDDIPVNEPLPVTETEKVQVAKQEEMAPEESEMEIESEEESMIEPEKDKTALPTVPKTETQENVEPKPQIPEKNQQSTAKLDNVNQNQPPKKETSSAKGTEHKLWLTEKMNASMKWLTKADKKSVSIQVMMRNISAGRELVRLLNNEWPLPLEKTHLFKVKKGEVEIFRVFYGEYPSISVGQTEIKELPKSVRVNSPYLHSIYRMQKELLQ